MTTDLLAHGWPGQPAIVVGVVRSGDATILRSSGDLTERRPWASVSKLCAALAALRVVESGRHDLDEPAGPEGSTLAHLLAHASGLGFELGDRVVPVGTRRVYSNAGIDLMGELLAPGDPAEWVRESVLEVLELSSATLEGRISADVVASTQDMVSLARELLSPALLSVAMNERMRTPFLPELAGITPPFGRQVPNWWGLGPELKGTKEHWMGHWPAESFGHFGRSGSMLLADPTTGLFICATSTEGFGPWAVELWPAWVDEVRTSVLS